MHDRASVVDKLRALLTREKYGILSVSDNSRAYGAIVAFCASNDLRTITFGTPVATRKYRMLASKRPVAFVVDDRSAGSDELMKVSAATLVGDARELDTDTALQAARAALRARHPRLEEFLETPEFAVFQIEVTQAVHVDRFANVTRWEPQRISAHG